MITVKHDLQKYLVISYLTQNKILISTSRQSTTVLLVD